MGQEQKEHTWDLIAKKLAREATPGELKELEDLLGAHPELYYPLQTVADFWKSSNPGDLEKAEQAFDRHLDRIKEYDIAFTPTIPDDRGQNQNTRHRRRSKTVLVTTMSLLVVLIGFFVVRFIFHQNFSK